MIVRGVLSGKPCAWFAPSHKMAREAWTILTSRLWPVVVYKNESDKIIRAVTGGSLELWSLEDPDAGRGRGYALVVVDEAARVPKLEYSWQNAIRPALADYRGSAWFLSTPRGRNFFWHLFRTAEYSEEWYSAQRPTAENPYISADEINAAREELPERVWLQEFAAEFVESEGSVFRGVLEAAKAQPEGPTEGAEYVFGVDWGKFEDFTVIQVLDITRRRHVWQERFRRIDWHLQVERLRSLCERYKPVAIIAERNAAGDPIIERLVRDGLPVRPFTTTLESKKKAIEALALAIERGDIELLDDPVLVGELLSFEAKRLPSGLLRYQAPEGQHDDCVMALAMAWQGIVGARANIRWL